jgi:hypothetical protein
LDLSILLQCPKTGGKEGFCFFLVTLNVEDFLLRALYNISRVPCSEIEEQIKK